MNDVIVMVFIYISLGPDGKVLYEKREENCK